MPNKMLILSIAIILTIAASIVNAAGRGGVQRMAIAPGTYAIPPKTTSRLKAFCLDPARKAPSSNNAFSSVLANNSTTFVKVGNKSMNLQEAINNGFIAIAGSGSNENRYGGDYSSLEFSNLANQEVSIEIKESSIVGEANELPPSLPKGSLQQFLPSQSQIGDEQHRDIQEKIWKVVMLKELGYFPKKYNNIDQALPRANQNFLKDYVYFGNLPKHGDSENIFEALFEDLELTTIYDNSKFIKESNLAGNGNYSAVNLYINRKPSGSTFYQLATEGQRPKNIDTPQQVIKTLNEIARTSKSENIYLFAYTEDPHNLDTLRVSLSAGAHNNLQPNLTVRLIDRSENGNDHQVIDGFFIPSKVKLEKTSDISVVAAGKHKGMYAAKVQLVLENNIKATVRVLAKTKEALLAFLSKFNALLAGADLTRVSVASLIVQARAEVKLSLNLHKDDDIIVEFDDQLGNIQIVIIDVMQKSS